jgi:ribosomal protein S18 acetylase RimI-like enzyme
MEKIKSTLPSDLPALARCNRAAFPGALASALGARYCAHMLSWYLSTDKTFLFHVEDGQGLCTGFCGGMISDGTLGTGSASGMAQHSFYPALWAFATHPWVLFHPEVRAKWPLLWKNIKMKLGLAPKVHTTTAQRQQQAQTPLVGLVVIGVEPEQQGKGYGSLLLREFERRAVEVYGIRLLQLTVRTDNAQAIRAYERNGWVISRVQGESTSMVKLC